MTEMTKQGYIFFFLFIYKPPNNLQNKCCIPLLLSPFSHNPSRIDRKIPQHHACEGHKKLMGCCLPYPFDFLTSSDHYFHGMVTNFV